MADATPIEDLPEWPWPRADLIDAPHDVLANTAELEGDRPLISGGK